MYLDLDPRDIVGDVTSAPQTFTSWDRCMTKTYCKWPAIIGIVVGCLVAITIIYCFARCLCCGAECCGCCLRCCGCGRSRGRHQSQGPNSRFQDNSYTQMPPTPYSGYQPSPAAMNYQQHPQFATFDVSSNKKINEDSLPAMPTWDTATKRRVEEFEEQPPHKPTDDVEMGHLGPQQHRTTRGGYNQVPNGPLSPSATQHNQVPNGTLSPPLNQPHQPYDYIDPSNGQHAYHSDLGAQRMPNHNAGYDDFEDAPGSPAPTYRTYAHSAAAAAPNHTDQFTPGVANHSPIEYNNHQQNQRSYAPSSTTGYEVTEYPSSTTTPYYQHQHQHQTRPSLSNQLSSGGGGYNQQQTSPTGQRPPSLLQVGRKPVNGSIREI